MAEKNIPCNDCSYFNGTNRCLFLDKSTTPITKCFAELYELTDLCDGRATCEACPQLLKGCLGDRTNPPKRLKVHPHEGQLKIKQSKAQHVGVLAGAQSGKTEFMPAVMHDEMLQRGNGDYMAVSSSFPLMDKKLVPIYRMYFEQYLRVGHWQEAKKKLNLEGGGWNSTIFFGSAKNESSLESATAKAAHLDECGQDEFTLEAYEAILRRVSGNNGRIFYTTTLYNFGWLKSEVYDRWEAGDPDYDIIQWDSIIRPGYSKAVWEDRRRKMAVWKFNMQLRGRYDRPAGQIYSDFDENIHIVKPFSIPRSWNWYVGIDPGGTHTALVWIAEEPAVKKYYIVHSYIEGNKTTPEHAASAMRRYEYSRVVNWRGGNLTNESQFREDWKAAGIPIQEPTIRNVEAMMDRVIVLLKERRLFIFDTEENTISNKVTGELSIKEEFNTFSRVLDANGKPTEKIKDEKKFHKLAALRYFASGIGGTGDYSTPVVWQETKIPSLGDVHDVMGDGNDEIPHF